MPPSGEPASSIGTSRRVPKPDAARLKLSIGKLSIGETDSGMLSIGKLSIGMLSIGKLSIGKLSIGKLSIGKLSIGAPVSAAPSTVWLPMVAALFAGVQLIGGELSALHQSVSASPPPSGLIELSGTTPTASASRPRWRSFELEKSSWSNVSFGVVLAGSSAGEAGLARASCPSETPCAGTPSYWEPFWTEGQPPG